MSKIASYFSIQKQQSCKNVKERDDDGLRIHGSKSNSFELLLTLLTGFPKDFCVTKLWKNFQNKSL